MIGAYRRVLINQASANLAYRWNILSGVILQLIQLLASLFVWRSIFASQELVRGYSYQEMAAYLILTSLLGVVFSSGHVFRLSSLVRKGTLNAYLVRPYSFLGDSLAVFIGGKVMEVAVTLLIGAGLWAAGMLRGGPVSAPALLLVMSNLLLLFLFGSLLGTLSFWLIEMWPLKPLYNSLMALLGGALFPIDLLPGIWREVVAYTPFSLFGYVNARALQGGLSSGEVWRFLLVSLGWSLLCFLLYMVLWRRGLRRYEGVSG